MASRTARDWLIWYFRQPFRLIVWFMETFARNRERLKEFASRKGVAATFKSEFILTFFVWLGIFAFLSTDEAGDRFTCVAKSLWPGAEVTSECAPQPWQDAPPKP